MAPNAQKLVIFGATGGTGRAAVSQALAAGHHVTAFVRSPDKLGMTHERLRLCVGDIFDQDAVRAAVAGQDAVLCFLGAPAASRDRIRERGTEAIVAAMQHAGIERIVCLSSHGIADTFHELPWVMRWFVVPLFLRRAFDDHEAQEAVVHGSQLDWTLVRPPHLHDGPRATEVAHGPAFDPASMTMKVAREDVAGFMLQQAVSGGHIQETVVVSAAA